MSKSFDPLACIPSADALRERLSETVELARKLEILLQVAEQLQVQGSTDESVREDSDKASSLEGLLAHIRTSTRSLTTVINCETKRKKFDPQGRWMTNRHRALAKWQSWEKALLSLIQRCNEQD